MTFYEMCGIYEERDNTFLSLELLKELWISFLDKFFDIEFQEFLAPYNKCINEFRRLFCFWGIFLCISSGV